MAKKRNFQVPKRNFQVPFCGCEIVNFLPTEGIVKKFFSEFRCVWFCYRTFVQTCPSHKTFYFLPKRALATLLLYFLYKSGSEFAVPNM